MASLEVLESKFEEHQKQCDLDKERFDGDIKSIRIALEGKISFKIFVWVLGIIGTVHLTIFGYLVQQMAVMAVQIDKLQDVTVAVREDVATINGKLDTFEAQTTK